MLKQQLLQLVVDVFLDDDVFRVVALHVNVSRVRTKMEQVNIRRRTTVAQTHRGFPEVDVLCAP